MLDIGLVVGVGLAFAYVVQRVAARAWPGTRARPGWRWFVAGLLGLSLAFGAAFRVSKLRSVQLLGTLVSRVETDARVVAVTFDDGPSSEHTPAILRTLREHDAVATFFVVGQQAAPDALRAIVEAGHADGYRFVTVPEMLEQ